MTKYANKGEAQSQSQSAEVWELSLGEIWAAFLRLKWLAVLILAAFLIGGTAYAFLARPLYRISVSLIPAANTSDSFGNRALGSLGGLASLVGADLGGSQGETVEALAVMRSRRFTTEFIRDNDLLPRLFPAKWDATTKKWIVPESEIPTDARAYAYFDGRVRKISEDKKTGLVTLTIDWFDREEAVAWAAELVRRVNEEMRSRTIAESTASLARLEQQAASTTVVAVQSSLAQLIEAELRRKTLASIRQDYVFRVVDPPAMPDKDDPVFPRKSFVIVVSVALASLLIAVVVVVSASVRVGRDDE